MKKTADEIQEIKQREEKSGKDIIRKEGIEKRKRAKKAVKQARWSGLIMLVIVMLIGFLMWVTGEVNKSTKEGKMIKEEPKTSLPREKIIVR